MVNKFLSGAALSATIFAANMAPVLANPTNIKTGNSVTVNSVAPKSNLVEIEGRTLTDAEAAKVEGEVFWKVVAIGAVQGAVWHGVTNCVGRRTSDCTWQATGSAALNSAAQTAFFASPAGISAGIKARTIPVFLGNHTKRPTFRIWR